VVEMRRNKNRGYQKLRVWIDAIKYYEKTCTVFTNFPYELKSLENKRERGEWIDTLMVKESNAAYGNE